MLGDYVIIYGRHRGEAAEHSLSFADRLSRSAVLAYLPKSSTEHRQQCQADLEADFAAGVGSLIELLRATERGFVLRLDPRGDGLSFDLQAGLRGGPTGTLRIGRGGDTSWEDVPGRWVGTFERSSFLILPLSDEDTEDLVRLRPILEGFSAEDRAAMLQNLRHPDLYGRLLRLEALERPARALSRSPPAVDKGPIRPSLWAGLVDSVRKRWRMVAFGAVAGAALAALAVLGVYHSVSARPFPAGSVPTLLEAMKHAPLGGTAETLFSQLPPDLGVADAYTEEQAAAICRTTLVLLGALRSPKYPWESPEDLKHVITDGKALSPLKDLTWKEPDVRLLRKLCCPTTVGKLDLVNGGVACPSADWAKGPSEDELKGVVAEVRGDTLALKALAKLSSTAERSSAPQERELVRLAGGGWTDHTQRMELSHAVYLVALGRMRTPFRIAPGEIDGVLGNPDALLGAVEGKQPEFERATTAALSALLAVSGSSGYPGVNAGVSPAAFPAEAEPGLFELARLGPDGGVKGAGPPMGGAAPGGPASGTVSFEEPGVGAGGHP